MALLSSSLAGASFTAPRPSSPLPRSQACGLPGRVQGWESAPNKPPAAAWTRASGSHPLRTLPPPAAVASQLPTQTLPCPSPDDVAALRAELEEASPLEIVDKALSLFGTDLAIAFSGAEDVALVELASLTGRPFRVFCLDTGRLNPETYHFLDQVRAHYGVAIEVMFPDAAGVQQLVQAKGLFSFYEDGHQECCSVRKVEPLKRALRGLRAWMTGQRRDQSADTRSSLQVVEVDGAFAGAQGPQSLVKFNPLARVSGATVWSLLEAQACPVNQLHSRGYVSIGCEPCTRPTLPHQHQREGRWWWESASSKECGLHSKKPRDTGAAVLGGLPMGPAVSTSHSPTPAPAPLQVPSSSAAAEAPTPPLQLSREDQEWPDLYVSPHVTTLLRDDVTALLDGAVNPDAETGAPAGAPASAPASWLVVVYAPWCPHCQALEPAVTKVAEALSQSPESRTRVAKFRGDRSERMFATEKLQVKSFPTIFMLRQPSSQFGPSPRLVKRLSERRDVGSLLRWVEALQ